MGKIYVKQNHPCSGAHLELRMQAPLGAQRGAGNIARVAPHADGSARGPARMAPCTGRVNHTAHGCAQMTPRTGAHGSHRARARTGHTVRRSHHAGDTATGHTAGGAKLLTFFLSVFLLQLTVLILIKYVIVLHTQHFKI